MACFLFSYGVTVFMFMFHIYTLVFYAGNTTQDEADVSTRVTELGVEGSRIHLHSSTSNQKQVIFFLFKKLKLRNYHCSLKIR